MAAAAAAVAESWGQRLKPIPGATHLENVLLAGAEVSFGRAASCTVSMPNVHYSGRHCVLTSRGDAVFLTNLSANGTWHKPHGPGRPQKLAKNEEKELKPGDSFSLLMPPQAVLNKFGAEAVAFELEARAAPVALRVAAGSPTFKRPAPKTKSTQAANTLEAAYDVNLRRELGRGQFATVYPCTSKSSGKGYAVKKIIKKKFLYHNKFKQNLVKEVKILRETKHTNIVGVVDVYETDEEVNLIMEIMKGGELFDYIIDRGRLEEEVSRGIVEQVLQAVNYLHTRNILHRDLKPENILLANKAPRGSRSSLEPLIVKLADFGIATIIGDQTGAQTYCGTPHYFSPEVHRRSKQKPSMRGGGEPSGPGYGKASDMWSIGVIVFVMLSGRPPFTAENLEEEVLDQAWSLDGFEWNLVTEQGKNFVRQLMNFNPDHRLSVEGALQHPWITGAAFTPEQPAAAVGTGGAVGGGVDRSETMGLIDEMESLSATRSLSAPGTLDLLPEDDYSPELGDGDQPAAAVGARSASDPGQASDASGGGSGVQGKRQLEEGSTAEERPAKRGAAAAVSAATAKASPAGPEAAPDVAAASSGSGFSWADTSQDSQSQDFGCSQSQQMDDDVGFIWLWQAGRSWKRYDRPTNAAIETGYQEYLEAEATREATGGAAGIAAIYELPGNEHQLHFEPMEARSGQELPDSCTGMRQTRKENVKKKRWVKRQSQEEYEEEHEKETKQNMARSKDERKKLGFLF